MKLLFDHLRRDYRGTPLEELLRDVTVFYNDDALQRAVDGDLELEQLPSLAPPYPKFFIECRLPLFEEAKTRHIRQMPYVGALIMALDYPDGVLAKATTLDEPYRWSYEVILFVESKSTGKIENMGAANVLLDADGQAMEFVGKDGQIGYCWFTWNKEFHERFSHDENALLPQLILDAALYTIGMLHCRNIGTDIIHPRRSEAHKFEKRFGLPLTSYHILKVTGKGGSAGDRIGAPTGHVMPLHWCRAHFRTYTEDAPLLGKHTGTFFVNAHVRGKLTAGAVTKDYQIEVHHD